MSSDVYGDFDRGMDAGDADRGGDLVIPGEVEIDPDENEEGE